MHCIYTEQVMIVQIVLIIEVVGLVRQSELQTHNE